MSQNFVKNERYQVKTPHGWSDFEGVTVSYHNHALKLDYGSNAITATGPHKIFTDGSDNPTKASELKVGDVLTGNSIEAIDEVRHDDQPSAYYDLFNVENKDHSYIANDIKVSNSDELAFAQPRVAREMWASVFPTLSCLAPDTYVLGDHGYMKIKHYFSGQEVPGEYFKIFNHNLYTHRFKKEPLSHGYVSPASETLIVTTKTGYQVEVTPKHPLLTPNGMIPAKNLSAGDMLRCDLGMKIFGPTKYHGEVPCSDEASGYPEYVMMYRRASVIAFLSRELHEDRPYPCLYQLKLLMANLGIATAIVRSRLRVIEDYLGLYESIFGDTIETIPAEGDFWVDHFHDEIVSIEESYQEVTYDFTVPDAHSFLQNGIMGSNTGGRCIVTSTPSDDETLFAELWRNAVKTIDEHGNELEVGINGFKALKVTWDQHPERDESYKRLQIAQFGEEKFRREHELEFISMEETLIDPVFLSTYEGIDPISKTGQIRWYKKLDREQIYVVGYDPSLGTGRDNAAIVIYEFPSMVQVGEWIHNKSDVPTQIKILKRILDMFRDAGFDEDNVYWSLENNSIGEAPLVMIKHEIGDDEFFGTFMRERKRRNTVRIRGGFYTDHTEKMKACNRFKIWLEQGKMTINSKALIAELKGFVAQGRTYKARPGDTDDIVMATMLVIRMVEILMQDEDEYMEELGVTASNLFDDDDDDEDGWGAPMPIL